MDFSFSDDQRALADLAARIFGDVSADRLKEVEGSSDAIDRELWRRLADAGLTGMGLADGHGGIVEQCIVLHAQGRTVAPAPLAATYVAASALDADVTASVVAGGTFATYAIAEPGNDDPYAPTVRLRDGEAHGTKTAVPAAHLAGVVVVTTAEGLCACDVADAAVERESTTSGEPRFTLTFDGVPARALDADVRHFVDHASVAVCALMLGVAERALEITAAYVSGREQFGRPLGSFQAVQQRAADAYVDVQAMRWTTWLAAWRLAAGLDASDAVDVAKFWAAEGGQRVASAAQHLHGGIGVDTDYPLHRYTRWAKVLEHDLGSATPRLARIGASIASDGRRSSL